MKAYRRKATAVAKLLVLLTAVSLAVGIGCDRAAGPAGAGTGTKSEAGGEEAANDDGPEDGMGGLILATGDSGLIVVEAESAEKLEEPMIVATDQDEQEGREVSFVWCPEGDACKDISNGKGRAVVKVEVPESGKYWFWARVWSHCTCGNETKFELRKGAVTIKGLDFKMLQPTDQVWQWLRKPGTDAMAAVELDAGTYEMHIKNHEDGMRVDKVLFSDRPPSEFVPVGASPQ